MSEKKDSHDGKILPPPSLIPIPKACKAAIIMGSIDSNSDIANLLVCNYCDAVVVRPPSLVEETTRHDPDGLCLVPTGISIPVAQHGDKDTSNSSDSEEDDQSPWTLVQCRCVHSLDSADVTNQNNHLKRKNIQKELSTQQKLTIEAKSCSHCRTKEGITMMT